MSTLAATANGNFTTAASWGVCSSAAALDSEVTNTSLGTGNTDSSTFVLAAVAVDAVLIKVASRVVGSPTNTITVHLRNSTTSTNVLSLTINVSDLAACDTTSRQGGWYLFKFGSTHTPNGTDSYLIRCTMSATTTAVTLWASTGTNIARQVRTTTTAAPAAGDRFIVVKEFTAAATATARSITMDNTAATVFGNSTGISTSTYTNAALAVGNGGTLTWGTSASTNYLLTLVGSVTIHSGGTYNCGTSGAEIPRTSTAILEFQPAATNDSRFACLGTAVVNIYGLSRTSGKNVVWCLLNTDEAAAQTTLGVDTDTGWLSGDEIGIASTSRTASESELRALSGNANAADMTVSSGLTNAHKGSVSDGLQAEVVLLTRNVIIRTNNAARFTMFVCDAAAVVTAQWTQFKYHGGSSNAILTTTGSATFDYCAWHEWSSGSAIYASASSVNNITVRHCVGYSTSDTFALIGSNVGSAITITDCVVVKGTNTGFNIQNATITFNACRAAGFTSAGFSLTDATNYAGANFGDNLVGHSNGGIGISVTSGVAWRNRAIAGWVAWRNGGAGVSLGGVSGLYNFNARLDNLIAFGNVTTNVQANGVRGPLTLRNPTIAGDTTFSTATGLDFSTGSGLDASLRIEGGTLGGGGGTKTTHTTRDILMGQSIVGHVCRMQIVSTSMLSTTEIALGLALSQGSWYSVQSPDGALAGTKTVYTGQGTLAYHTSIVHAPYAVSEQLLPNTSGGATLQSSAVGLNVAASSAPTVSVWVYKHTGYNGSIQPRLVLKCNPAVGVTSDAVLDTHSGTTGVWEQLSATLPTITANGKVEMCVEVDGTGDGAYVGEWAAA